MMMLILTSAAVAGERGNGGDVVVCRNPDGTIISAELLDYYEGRVMRKLKVTEYPDISDDQFFEMVGAKLNEMEDYIVGFHVKTAKELMTNIHEYLESGHTSSPDILFTEEDLTDIPDSGELVVKKGCKIEQIAIWLKKSYPEDPSFIIKATLLPHLSQRDLRGLVLHELMYIMLSVRNADRRCEMKDSVPVRYYHQKMLSAPVDDFKFTDHLKFVETSCGGYSFLKKSRLDVLFVPHNLPGEDTGDGPYRVWVWDLTREPIQQIPVMLIMNRDGKLDHELSMKRGKFAVKAESPVYGYGLNLGYVEYGNNLYPDFPLERIHFGNDISNWIGFGTNEIKVVLEKSSGPVYQAMDWGLLYAQTNSSRNWAPMQIPMAATTRKQSKTRTFEATLTEDFNIYLK